MDRKGRETYDVVIVGSGPAGYAAALYATREGLRTLVFGGFESGGQLMLSWKVENYPGFEEGIAGTDLMDKFEMQAVYSGAEIRARNVERVDFSERPFKLWEEGEEEPVLARSVVIATGAKARWLGLESEERLMGRGVSGCATCDGFFFKDKKVAVVGGGDTAMEEALFLTRYASEVIIIHRREEFGASRVMLDRSYANPKITFLTDTVVEEILGEHSVSALRIHNTRTDKSSLLHTDGVFIAVGHAPASDLFEGKVEMDGAGYVLQKERTMTSVSGVFAAGEVADKSYRQIATAVGDGCRVALDTKRWLGGLR